MKYADIDKLLGVSGNDYTVDDVRVEFTNILLDIVPTEDWDSLTKEQQYEVIGVHKGLRIAVAYLCNKLKISNFEKLERARGERALKKLQEANKK